QRFLDTWGRIKNLKQMRQADYDLYNRLTFALLRYESELDKENTLVYKELIQNMDKSSIRKPEFAILAEKIKYLEAGNIRHTLSDQYIDRVNNILKLKVFECLYLKEVGIDTFKK